MTGIWSPELDLYLGKNPGLEHTTFVEETYCQRLPVVFFMRSIYPGTLECIWGA